VLSEHSKRITEENIECSNENSVPSASRKLLDINPNEINEKSKRLMISPIRTSTQQSRVNMKSPEL
jgi:hypothetical protein